MTTPQTSSIVGIDLGTTNSAIAIVIDGEPQILRVDDERLMPSVVGASSKQEYFAGRTALNQYAAFPERTIRSIKRKMGSGDLVKLGKSELSPVEVSAIILRHLKKAAESELGHPVERAVITVPAFFDERQREATVAAGQLAGLDVVRIVNEPTAAALCYAAEDDDARHYLVYDLGGGTFDVSIVRVQGELTEVLASDGDVHLGGDDMDESLTELLLSIDDREKAQHMQTALDADPRARARIRLAAEDLKIRLSNEVQVIGRVENLIALDDGSVVNIDKTLLRDDYEEAIDALVERTIESVHRALDQANIDAQTLDDVILVGGASRTPLIGRVLHEELGLPPRMDVNPDEAVVLGAALLAGRLDGIDSMQVLIDVTTHGYGIEAISPTGDLIASNVIPKNTPLPVERSRLFYTAQYGQPLVQTQIYEGESELISECRALGEFTFENLDRNAPPGSRHAVRMRLDIDGILHVTMREVHTGRTHEARIEGVYRPLSAEELEASRARLGLHEQADLFTMTDSSTLTEPHDAPEQKLSALATETLDRARALLADLDDDDDREELEELIAAVEASAEGSDERTKALRQLDDALFYLID